MCVSMWGYVWYMCGMCVIYILCVFCICMWGYIWDMYVYMWDKYI